MKNRNGLDNNDNWETPDWLYKQLDEEFHFDFDPCPLNSGFDGLEIEWGNVNFVNPPYNRTDKPKFIKKSFDEWRKGKTCVLLIPVSTSTKQFHELLLPNAEIRFLKGRIAFKGYNTKGIYSDRNKGMHDSMIVILRGNKSIP
jgi:site-specific DNA-methyltransferase (adenine-specific)